jgi:DHA1 family multidrug resistance protein-like MFS transporter
MAFVRDPWQLALLQGLMGVAAGGLIPSANALIAHLTPVERRGAIFGLSAAIAAVGGFVGPLAGAFLATSLGFRATFIASGTLLLAVAAMVIWSQDAAESRGREVAESRRKMAT